MVITLTTPGGTPAASRIATIASAVSGVSPAGLSTIGAAGRERGSDLAGRHRRREVPGRHEDADADGFVRDDDLVRAGRCRRERPVEPDGFLAVPAEELGGIGDLAAGIGQRLAVLARDQRGEFVGATRTSGRTRGAGSRRVFAARTRPTPMRRVPLRRSPRSHRGVGVRDGRDHLAGRRIEHVEALPVGSRDVLAADAQFGRDASTSWRCPSRQVSTDWRSRGPAPGTS